MERKALAAAAANYPYLRGLWAIPFGIGMVLAGVSNLQHRPTGPALLGIFGVGVALCAVATLLITRHYRDSYGTVTPTRSRQIRHGVAIVAWAVVLFVGANKYLLWSPDSAVCVYAAAFAVAILVYYAVLVGLRPHHLVIWGLVFVAALLPVWGRLGADRDAVAMFPLAAALIASGLFDQRRLARSFRSPRLEDNSLADSSLGG